MSSALCQAAFNHAKLNSESLATFRVPSLLCACCVVCIV